MSLKYKIKNSDIDMTVSDFNTITKVGVQDKFQIQ